ncbi:MAG: galactose-1-phosphate uridylyltransferase [Candidatus Omnitrophica bacterium]|nr:galactose-1-phosphate uridylyltransferase [Candidatus Omnitrophota bacterium]
MPELRKDPLMGRWVIISTERAKRPDEFLPLAPVLPETEPDCPFCEGNESKTPPEIMAVRPAGLAPNSRGWKVRVVPSIAPVLRIEGKMERRPQGIYDVASGIGAHEVIVETPQHLPSLSHLTQEQIQQVLEVTLHRMTDLEKDQRFKSVLLFKNVGENAGSGKTQHARAQLIALPVIPVRLKDELHGANQYFQLKERCIFCDILRQELDAQQRLAVETSHFVALAPFASRFPFELWILPKGHAADFTKMTPHEKGDLARILQWTFLKLSRVLKDPPYNTILHTAPYRRAKAGAWRTIDQDFHWHLEIMPRLTRVAGFEWGSGFYINPTPPEEAAKFMKEAGVPVMSRG